MIQGQCDVGALWAASIARICRAGTAVKQQHDGKFRNAAPRFLTAKADNTVPAAPIPVQRLTAAHWPTLRTSAFFALGHFTLLLQLDGAFGLTDPVFSDRASPRTWAGPKRLHAPPIAIEELPPIKGVILSHDHCCHLNPAAFLQPAPTVEVFAAPLGAGDRLIAWGVDPAKVRQLDWWQQVTAPPAIAPHAAARAPSCL